ncbi:MAG: chromosomal replication initiation protein DnaA, partial [Rhodococcus sp.]|nr:chromosomal replication initiation protein DnaA [Rhodococcus sp. (in: high G+C Gram-positive bacteria)]
MTDEPNALADVWSDVVDELTADGGALTKGQKAWLALVKPLTLAQGFALLSVPSSLAQEAIERGLRGPILRSLNRNLGHRVEGLGVRIELSEDAADPAEDPYAVPRDTLPLEGLPIEARPAEPRSHKPGPHKPGPRDMVPTFRHRRMASLDHEVLEVETGELEEVDDDREAITDVRESWPSYFTQTPAPSSPAVGSSTVGSG